MLVLVYIITDHSPHKEGDDQVANCHGNAIQTFIIPLRSFLNTANRHTYNYIYYVGQEDSNFVKLISRYYNETVQCGGKKGDSIKVQGKSCVQKLQVSKMKVWGVELLNCYNSDDQCGRFSNVDSISFL